jgi:hypothetical protein
MEQVIAADPRGTRTAGRWWFVAGAGLVLLGLAAYVAQVAFKVLTVPWYAPVLATAGLGLMAVAMWRRRTAARMIGLGLFALVTAFEWAFLLSLSRLPAYTGPVRVGQTLPPFATTLADGTPFTERDLATGVPTVLVFFRGRW